MSPILASPLRNPQFIGHISLIGPASAVSSVWHEMTRRHKAPLRLVDASKVRRFGSLEVRIPVKVWYYEPSGITQELSKAHPTITFIGNYTDGRTDFQITCTAGEIVFYERKPRT